METRAFSDMVKPIIQDSDPLLRTVSEAVVDFDQSLQDLVVDMLATMSANHGRGLSAIQIGVAKRVIVFTTTESSWIMVNPVMTRSLNRNTVEKEGCLSIPPARWRYVSRPAKCDVTWQNGEGAFQSATLSGDAARVFQHEYDHLDGILITDKPHVNRAR
jgi:peptide deformylase